MDTPASLATSLMLTRFFFIHITS